ncbi:19225_t:CDS:2 [Racocetra fulgida]|uniref:19225_t:CDS:1 n=1 Tax=Racocetra fulgida TaxID=60492 RepID=A0A9N8VA44_9GLOM|nr:19225_t:CDS:2 [Racocetra fulgida]
MVKSCLPTKTEKGISYGLGPRSIKDKVDKIKNEPDFYENSPFLTLAKELLKLVKENKVEVIFLSAYDKRVFPDGDPRKKKIFKETFGRFSNCSLNLLGFDSEDDNPKILRNILKNHDKIIVVAPFYLTIKHHEKVLLIKTSISNLTKQDFQPD